MAIDFPNSPSVNQIYTVGSRSWIWDGSTWNIYANVPNRYIQDAAPSSPQSGDQWFESDTGRLFVYYDSAWVEIGNATDIAGALQPGQVTALTAVTSLTTDDVFPVIDNPSSATAANKITYGNLVTAMDASLAPGLVLVKTQTIGSAVSSVTVTNAFSSTYDGYKIVITGGVGSTTTDMRIQLGPSSVTNYNSKYYGGLFYIGTLSDTTVAVATTNNTAQWQWVGYITTTSLTASFDVISPFQTTPTYLFGGHYASPTSTGFMNAMHDVSSSFTDFKIFPNVGTMTGGTIRVYGYRNS